MVAVYDYLLTISAEVEVWQHSLSVSTAVFLLIRYLTLIAVGITMAVVFSGETMCTRASFIAFEIVIGLMMMTQAGKYQISSLRYRFVSDQLHDSVLHSPCSCHME